MRFWNHRIFLAGIFSLIAFGCSENEKHNRLHVLDDGNNSDIGPVQEFCWKNQKYTIFGQGNGQMVSIQLDDAGKPIKCKEVPPGTIIGKDSPAVEQVKDQK